MTSMEQFASYCRPLQLRQYGNLVSWARPSGVMAELTTCFLSQDRPLRHSCAYAGEYSLTSSFMVLLEHF